MTQPTKIVRIKAHWLEEPGADLDPTEEICALVGVGPDDMPTEGTWYGTLEGEEDGVWPFHLHDNGMEWGREEVDADPDEDEFETCTLGSTCLQVGQQFDYVTGGETWTYEIVEVETVLAA